MNEVIATKEEIEINILSDKTLIKQLEVVKRMTKRSETGLANCVIDRAIERIKGLSKELVR